MTKPMVGPMRPLVAPWSAITVELPRPLIGPDMRLSLVPRTAYTVLATGRRQGLTTPAVRIPTTARRQQARFAR